MRCVSCNSYIPEGATYCLECGVNVDSTPTVTCQKCGASTSASAKFCRKCGATLYPPPDYRKGDSHKITGLEVYPGQTCPRCGEPLGTSTKYCRNCGILVSGYSKPDSAAPEKVKSPSVDEKNSKIEIPEAVEINDEVKACPKCGTKARGSGRFCYECGKFLGSDVEDVICPECGMSNILRYARCQYCGGKLPSKR